VDNKCLPRLLDALPLTLTTLDLAGSFLDDDSAAILRSLVNDNDRLPSLKQLIVNDRIRYQLETSESSRVELIERDSFAARILKEESSINVFIGCVSKEQTWALVEAELAKPDCPIRTMKCNMFGEDANFWGQHLAKVLIDEKCPLQMLECNFSDMDEFHEHIVIDALKRNRSLRGISITGTFDADTMRTMSDAFMDKTMLRVLRIESTIGFTDSVSDERITHLSRCLPTLNSLERLDLKYAFITDNGLKILLNVLPLSLRHLILKNNAITAQSLPVLLKFMNESQLRNLQLMSVERNTISIYRSQPGAVATLMDKICHAAEQRHCEFLIDLDDTIQTALDRYREKEELLVHVYHGRDTQMIELASELCKQPEATHGCKLIFTLQWCISAVALKLLSQILTTVAFSEFAYTGSNLTSEDATVLLDVLANNTTLESLDMSENKLTYVAVQHLLPLFKNENLKTLSLKSNNLDDEAAALLATALSTSKLHRIDLSKNKIGDQGLAHILSSVPDTLVDLSITNTEITAASVPLVRNFLTKNTKLGQIILDEKYSDDWKALYKENPRMQ
jgi:Ran GTPase-activating protein (RanGAP) involved in mRNA processing and transport